MPLGRPKVEWLSVPCFACGKVVERRATDLAKKRSPRVFCGTECLRKIGAKPRRKADVVCEQCGTAFYPKTGTVNRFCSKPCADAWLARNGEHRDCEVCGKRFWMAPSDITGWRAGRFCSRQCMGLGQIKRPLAREFNGKPARLDGRGYVWIYVPDEARTTYQKGWVLEHRYVVEQALGRTLEKGEDVHHKDENKQNNDISNLQVLESLEHLMVTQANAKRDREQLAEYRKRYGPLT